MPTPAEELQLAADAAANILASKDLTQSNLDKANVIEDSAKGAAADKLAAATQKIKDASDAAQKAFIAAGLLPETPLAMATRIAKNASDSAAQSIIDVNTLKALNTAESSRSMKAADTATDIAKDRAIVLADLIAAEAARLVQLAKDKAAAA